MTKKERVQEAVGHHQTDCVPWNIELTGGEAKKFCEQVGIKEEEFFDFAGNHIDKISYNIGGSESRPGFWQDEFGVVWDRSGHDKDIGVIVNVLLNEPTLKGFQFPLPPAAEVRKITEKVLNNGNDTFKLGKIGTTLFERAWSLRGMETCLMDLCLEPAFAEELLDRILDYNLALIETALEQPIDGFYFGDDYGGQQGLLMSPDLWRRFFEPRLAKMFAKVKRAGRVVALHSCGNIEAILPDLINIGLDIYQTVQPEVYDLKKLKREFGRNLAFLGAISTQRTLPFVAPDELKCIVGNTIDIMAEGGGFIAGPTHRIPADVPVENVLALIETLKKHEK